VRSTQKTDHEAVRGVRATGDLEPGERVWIISDTAVEGGFSGSPVLDDRGHRSASPASS